MHPLLTLLTGLCALFCTTLLSAAEVPSGVKLAENQILTRTLRGDPESVDPHMAIGIPADHVTRELFEGLVTQDLQGNIIPGQAESWSVSDDGKTWVFKIREGLQWSDKTPLTARDFEYSFKRLVNPETAATYGWYPSSMKILNAEEILKKDSDNKSDNKKTSPDSLGVAASSDNTLTIKLTAPTPYLLPMLTHRSMRPVPKHMIEKHGTEWAQPENIVVNGPFDLSKRVIHERIVLKRNPLYWNDKDTVITQVVFLPIESETAALNRYRTGEVDIVNSIPTSHYKKLANEIPNQLKSAPTLATYYITFNTRKKPFDDIRVRKALSYVILREKITANILGQGQTPAYTFTPSTVSGFTPPKPDYQQMSELERLAEARRLLSEAGYSKKTPLEFTYVYNATDVNRHIAIAIQEMWQRQLPVKVTLENQEWAAYLQNKLSGKYQAARALWGGDYDDAVTMLDMNTPEHANNSSFYDNPAYNQLLKEAKQIQNREERNRLYAEAELILADDMPIAPVYWNSNNYLIKPDLRGVSYTNPEGRIYAREIYRVKQQ